MRGEVQLLQFKLKDMIAKSEFEANINSLNEAKSAVSRLKGTAVLNGSRICMCMYTYIYVCTHTNI